MAKQHVCQNVDADEADFGPIPVSEKENIERENAMRRYEQEETQKSKLLSAITEYVHYQSGCTLDTMMRSEKLTDQHTIRIGTGFGNSITFPSKQADELLEFMLLQKVIAALKAFKQNCFM
jgi:hypothetical protein